MNSARGATCDLFMVVDNVCNADRSLLFKFETILTEHKVNQSELGPATVMAYDHPDQVEEFFKRLAMKLALTLEPSNAKCTKSMVVNPKL